MLCYGTYFFPQQQQPQNTTSDGFGFFLSVETRAMLRRSNNAMREPRDVRRCFAHILHQQCSQHLIATTLHFFSFPLRATHTHTHNSHHPTMGERKVINKYIPADFDPSLVPRGKKLSAKDGTVYVSEVVVEPRDFGLTRFFTDPLVPFASSSRLQSTAPSA